MLQGLEGGQVIVVLGGVRLFFLKSQPCPPPCRRCCELWNDNITLVKGRGIVCRDCIQRFSN
jgi:hypothetical protein